MSESNGKSERRTNNTLTHGKSYRVTSWIDTRRDYIRNGNLTARQVAAEVSEAVGFTVTMNNVYAACKVLEIELPHGSKVKGIKNAERLRQVVALVENMAKVFEQLSGDHKRLTDAHNALASRVDKLHAVIGSIPSIVREHDNMLQDIERQMGTKLSRVFGK